MIHVIPKKKEHPAAGALLAAALTVACLVIAVTVMREAGIRAKAENQKALEAAIRRATVQCYALEGRYPPSVEYLEQHYGISIDREVWAVFYDGWAENVMPDITVLPRGEGK